MKAQPLAADSVETLERQLVTLRGGEFAPTLAIVFASVTHDLAEVGRVFREAGIDVFGASSSGEIVGGGAGDVIRERSIVALVLDLDRSAYGIRLVEQDGRTSFRRRARSYLRGRYPKVRRCASRARPAQRSRSRP